MAITAPEAPAPPRSANGRRHLGLTDGLLFLMALIWAVNYSVLKFGTRLVHPLAYNGLRIPLAAILQFGVASAMRLPPVARHDAIRLVLLGMVGNGIYQIFFILGQAQSRVATTVLILASGPALAAIIGRVRGSEQLTRRSWFGIGLQLLGVSSVVMGTAGIANGTDTLLGVGLVFASALSWAWFSVLVQPFTERVAGLHVGAYTMLGGAVVSLLVAVPAMLATPWVAVSPAVYGALAYSTVGAMVIAYLFWYHGVRTLGPTHTSMYSNLQPLLAMAIAWAMLGEMPTKWQLAGAALIMTGLLVARTAAHEPEAG